MMRWTGEHNKVTQTGLECQGRLSTRARHYAVDVTRCASAVTAHPEPQCRAALRVISLSGKADIELGHAVLVMECYRAHSDLRLNLPLWLHKNITSYSILSSPLITHLENPSLFPPPFLVFTWKGRQYCGKTKQKPEYDAVGKHQDSLT